jgi:putative membrane protein
MFHYLKLALVAIVLLQSCRPSTNDKTGFSTPGSKDTTQQQPASGEDAAMTEGSTATDSSGNKVPMQGEVGSPGDFMIAAAEAGLTEVKLAELAMERSVTPKVKEFAQMMLKDHNAANAELRTLAQKKNVELPSSLCMECKAKYDALSKKEHADFDSTYMQLMIKDHKAVLERFVFQTTAGGDKDIKQWAAQKIPTLQHHLNTAQAWQRPASAGQ